MRYPSKFGSFFPAWISHKIGVLGNRMIVQWKFLKDSPFTRAENVSFIAVISVAVLFCHAPQPAQAVPPSSLLALLRDLLSLFRPSGVFPSFFCCFWLGDIRHDGLVLPLCWKPAAFQARSPGCDALLLRPPILEASGLHSLCLIHIPLGSLFSPALLLPSAVPRCCAGA